MIFLLYQKTRYIYYIRFCFGFNALINKKKRTGQMTGSLDGAKITC